MIRLAILMLLISGLSWAIDVPVPPKEKQSSLMDILNEAGRQCRAMGPLACRGFVAVPIEKPRSK